MQRFNDFILFLKNPNHPNYPNISVRQKLLDICFYYLVIDFIIAIALWYFVELAEQMGWFNPLKTIEFDHSIYWQIFGMLVFGPLFEEGIFRLFLGYCRYKWYFKWVFYGSAIVFGLIHIPNYQLDDTHYFFVPLITTPQIFGGLMLGFIRINYGFWYGMLHHALFNALALLLGTLF